MKRTCLAMVLLAAGTGGCSSGMSEQDWLSQRQSIKNEILAELRAERAGASTHPSGTTTIVAGAPALSEKSETGSTSPATPATDPVLDPALAEAIDARVEWLVRERRGPLGTVEGRLLDRGAGLADVPVRIVRMEAFRSKMSADYRAEDHYDVRTDADGRYTFTDVEPGKYKLLWIPPDQDGWIRSISVKPDVVAAADETAMVRAIETGRGLLRN